MAKLAAKGRAPRKKDVAGLAKAELQSSTIVVELQRLDPQPHGYEATHKVDERCSLFACSLHSLVTFARFLYVLSKRCVVCALSQNV
eukprot:6466557-Amphidinium_carterae.2